MMSLHHIMTRLGQLADLDPIATILRRTPRSWTSCSARRLIVAFIPYELLADIADESLGQDRNHPAWRNRDLQTCNTPVQVG